MNSNIKLDNIQISKATRILYNNGLIIIGNVIKSGLWIKIRDKDFEYLKPYIGTSNGYKNLMLSLSTVEQQEYFTNLLEALAKIYVLEKKNSSLVDSHVKNLSLELTTACNLRCKHCSGMYGSKEISSLSDSQFKKIIKWAADNQLTSISLSGGEPFCLPNIYEKLEYIHNNFNGKISVITNATLFASDKLHILKSCVDEISISLDGYDEKSVDFIRGEGTFKKVIYSIAMLHNAGIDNISASMVLTSDNSNHIKDFHSLCKELKVKPITRIYSIKGRALKNYEYLISDEDKGAEDKILSHVNMLSICNAGISTLSINVNGKITLCPATEDSNIFLGTVDELDKVVNNLERIKRTCIVDEILPCKSCNVKYFCSSKCYAMNLNIFYNPTLREQRCKKYKEKLQKYVWG